MSIAFYGAGTPVYDWCVSRDTSGRTTTRTAHDPRNNGQGVFVCQQCKQVVRVKNR